MTTFDISSLRNGLRELRCLGGALGEQIDREETAPEMLDLLALLAGLKPVFLLGRGLDDPRWVAGILAIARGLGLRAVEGPYWDATPFADEMTGWYAARTRAALAPFRAWYVCGSAETERAVRAVGAAGGRLTAGEEARLLGYPECCVAAHYARALAFHEATLSILRRRAGGEAARMQALFDAAGRLSAETPAERAGLAAVAQIVPAPFGSWNMCARCAEEGDSPSALLSRRYAALARTVDADWADTLAVSAAPPPRWMP